MANPEHTEILKQGVKTWNRWRRGNPTVDPDLTDANLQNVNLREVYLRGVDLCRADLSGAMLQRAVLSEANLGQANLSQANLAEAELWRAILSEADMDKANLYGADLREADLTEANLFKSVLRGANLRRASLSKADMSEAFLSGADLAGAELCEVLLIETDLREANLRGVNLEKANLTDADCRFSSLISSRLNGVVLTGAKLFGAAKDNWVTTNIKCEYVYWDEEGTQRLPKHRCLEPGEFERLYAALPTIEYVFENGMTPIDPLIMDRVVMAIREKEPEFDIKIDSINARGLAPSIKFTVQKDEYKEPALEEVRKGYDERINRLEAEKDHLYQLLGRAIDKAGDFKLIIAAPGAIVATDGATVNIQQHVHNAVELQKAIADEPEQSESFATVAKKTALEIVGGAIKDIAKGQVKEAAKQIVELGKDLGPLLIKSAPVAYEFFRSLGA